MSKKNFLYVLLIVLSVSLLFTVNPSLAATINVDTTADENTNNGVCSLREAIIATNNNSDYFGCVGTGAYGIDRINVPAGTYILFIDGAGNDNATTGDLDITDTANSVMIVGEGAQNTIVQTGSNVYDRIFHLLNSNAIISDMTIRYGNNVSNGGGILAASGGLGLQRVVVTENTASTSGGGVQTDTALIMDSSTISGNNVLDGDGGGIYKNGSGTFVIANSTFSGNNVMGANGGGIYISGTGTCIIANTTFSGNVTATDGGGIYHTGAVSTLFGNVTINGNSAESNSTGGGIYNASGLLTIQNTIVANSPSGGDCGGTITSNGYNIDTDGTCNLTATGDQPNTDPDLLPLADNGGPTLTHALRAGSPAIDTGDNSLVGSLIYDQRGVGYERIWDGDRDGTATVDIGAYEYQLAAIADSILFPWVVRSSDVTTVISVVNTAQTWAESAGLPFHDNRLHIEYWHKLTTDNDQEEQCMEYNFEVTSSKDDMVTWDMAGHFNNGLPMFNDRSNEVIAVPDMTLAVEDPRRAFLIVDNYTDTLTDAGTNVDGTLYGEATIIEHKTGAAWGYIAYNAIGGPNDFSDNSYRDQQGEVIGAYETTQTTLLNPNDAITKLFITPTFNEGDTGVESDQRRGNINTRVQLCRYPERSEDDVDPYTGHCIGGGIWNNEEGGFSFSTKKEIVCTTADNIVDFFGGAGSSAYTQWVASGKAGWSYLITQSGNIDSRDGTEAHEEEAEAIIGKLEYGTGLSWDGSITDTINTFVWLRDNANYLEHCADYPTDWRCEPGGINIIHNEYYQERGACCIGPPEYICVDLTEAECTAFGNANWIEGALCGQTACY